MNIKYIKINETDIKAIATYDTKYPEKLDENICELLIKLGKVRKKDITMQRKFEATSHAFDKESFDEKIGKNVARDKILIKYYAEMQRVYTNYITALQKYTDDMYYKKCVMEDKVENAYRRYINY